MFLATAGFSILACVGLYGFFTAPRLGRRAKIMAGQMYAHRGLHGQGASENGLNAFARACAAGVGIEFDVRFTKDGELVVFHDDDLARMCGDERNVCDVTLADIKTLRLPDGGEIPTLDEALRLVKGQVPLLVEIKHAKNITALSKAVFARLQKYDGPYVVESFNPLCLRWFRKNARQVIRGQLVQRRKSYHGAIGGVGAFLLSALFTNVLARPDFVAYESFRAKDGTIRLQRRVYKTQLAAWTVADGPGLKTYIARGESAIFETPQEKKNA